MVVFGGAVVVTFNTRVLGGKITFFESVSILGYCIFPLFLMGGIIKLLTVINFAHLLIKLALVIGGIIWGVICTYHHYS
jgi:protein YIPF6